MLAAITGAALAGALPVDVDIPYWYDQVPTATGESFDRAIMRVASSVTIMAYRNQADKVLAVAAGELENAAAMGTPAWIGINTGPTGGDPPDTSYQGQSATAIERDFQLITQRGRLWPTFVGIALHDSDSLPAA